MREHSVHGTRGRSALLKIFQQEKETSPLNKEVGKEWQDTVQLWSEGCLNEKKKKGTNHRDKTGRAASSQSKKGQNMTKSTSCVSEGQDTKQTAQTTRERTWSEHGRRVFWRSWKMHVTYYWLLWQVRTSAWGSERAAATSPLASLRNSRCAVIFQPFITLIARQRARARQEERDQKRVEKKMDGGHLYTSLPWVC